MPTPGGRPLVTTDSYNLQDELTSITYTDDTPTVTYFHDSNGNLRIVRDGAGAHALGYNALNQLTSETGLANGSWLQHTFDAYGRPTGYTLHDPQSAAAITYGYDPNTGQMTTVTSPNISATYGYDPTCGRLLTTTAGPLLTTRTPDTQGRLQSIVTTNTAANNANNANNATLVSVAYGYDGQNRRVSATREDGSYWSYGYDGRSEVASGVKYYSDNTPIPGMSYAYAYDPIGNRTSTTVNTATANYTPNALNQYTQRDVPPRAEVVAQVNAASPTTVTAAVNGVGVSFPPANSTPNANSVTASNGTVTSVELDQHGTLYGTISVNNNSGAAYQSTRVLALSNTAPTPTVDATNGFQYLAQTPEQFQYDHDGNLIQDGRWIYTWDAENRLTQLQATAAAVAAGAPNSTIIFAYDSKGRRVGKVVATYDATRAILLAAYQRQFAYDGWNLIQEYETNPLNVAASIPLRSYTWGIDLSGTTQGAGGAGGLVNVTELSDDGTTTPGNYATLFDGNGNILELIALGGPSIASSFEYGPFGEAVRASGVAAASPFRFSTKYEDAEWSGIGYGHRYYCPSIGRWASRDPIAEGGGTNIYTFVRNDPTIDYDADGRASLKTPPNFQLSFKFDPLTLGTCGKFSVGRLISVVDTTSQTANVSGVVIQQITFAFKINGSTSMMVDRYTQIQSPHTYWEAFTVSHGTGWDSWHWDAFPCTSGALKISASAMFYAQRNQDWPTSMRTKNPNGTEADSLTPGAFARGAPSTTQPPFSWYDDGSIITSNVFSNSLTVKWKCRDGVNQVTQVVSQQ